MDISNKKRWEFPIKKSTILDSQIQMRAPDLVANPYASLEQQADPYIPSATLQIYDFIQGYLARAADPYVNRASSASMCYKRRWYQARGAVGTPLTPRKEVNFLLGDLSERVVLYFIANGCVGPNKLYSEVDFGEVLGTIHFQGKELKIYKQLDLSLFIGEMKITAHADGFGKRNSDGKWELIECKSASNFGFQDFQRVGPKEYLKQSNVLMRTSKARKLKVENTRFFFLRKETGHLWDQVHSFDPELWRDIKEEYLAAQAPEEPKAPFGRVLDRKGRTVAAFPCTYCPYLQLCQGKFETEWTQNRNGGQVPTYVFKERK